jgi:extradiol dioxygenase family protein
VIQGGNATIYVSDGQRSVDFYSGVLGLRVVFRAGDHWAQLDAGGLSIGLHPAFADPDGNPLYLAEESP